MKNYIIPIIASLFTGYAAHCQETLVDSFDYGSPYNDPSVIYSEQETIVDPSINGGEVILRNQGGMGDIEYFLGGRLRLSSSSSQEDFEVIYPNFPTDQLAAGDSIFVYVPEASHLVNVTATIRDDSAPSVNFDELFKSIPAGQNQVLVFPLDEFTQAGAGRLSGRNVEFRINLPFANATTEIAYISFGSGAPDFFNNPPGEDNLTSGGNSRRSLEPVVKAKKASRHKRPRLRHRINGRVATNRSSELKWLKVSVKPRVQRQWSKVRVRPSGKFRYRTPRLDSRSGRYRVQFKARDREGRTSRVRRIPVQGRGPIGTHTRRKWASPDGPAPATWTPPFTR